MNKLFIFLLLFIGGNLLSSESNEETLFINLKPTRFKFYLDNETLALQPRLSSECDDIRLLTTELMQMVLANDVEQVKKYLSEERCFEETDEIGDTALLLAAKNGRDDIATLLIENGAKIDVTDKYGNTVIENIIQTGCSKTYKLLYNKENITKENCINHLMSAKKRIYYVEIQEYIEGIKQIIEYLESILKCIDPSIQVPPYCDSKIEKQKELLQKFPSLLLKEFENFREAKGQ